jgi:hypothetical protein
MISALYERDGWDLRPQDGKTSERQFAIIVFVIGCAAPGLSQTTLRLNPHRLRPCRAFVFFPPMAEKSKPPAMRVVGDS